MARTTLFKINNNKKKKSIVCSLKVIFLLFFFYFTVDWIYTLRAPFEDSIFLSFLLLHAHRFKRQSRHLTAAFIGAALAVRLPAAVAQHLVRSARLSASTVVPPRLTSGVLAAGPRVIIVVAFRDAAVCVVSAFFKSPAAPAVSAEAASHCPVESMGGGGALSPGDVPARAGAAGAVEAAAARHAESLHPSP